LIQFFCLQATRHECRTCQEQKRSDSLQVRSECHNDKGKKANEKPNDFEGGGCRRGGGGTAKERGRIDKGPPRRRQSGADGCPLSDEANCRTCPQRGQELYEKRKKTTEPPRSRRTRDDLREAPPQWSVPPNDGSQGQISFALGNLSPLRGGKPRGHEGERLGGERPAAAGVADKGREKQNEERSNRPSNKQQKNEKKGKG
jgi:hypothetical protein